MNDDINKGKDPTPPVANESKVPETVGGGGDLASKLKEYNQSANKRFYGTPKKEEPNGGQIIFR